MLIPTMGDSEMSRSLRHKYGLHTWDGFVLSSSVDARRYVVD